MNSLDYVVLIGTILGIAAYGMWRTRHRADLNSYLKGNSQTPWYAIGLSVMATQASAITFLSTPGQGFLGGLSFIQIYFGVPLALIIISVFFLPMFRKMNVYTAYEFLEKRFDFKTRLLGAVLFLLQRGLGAGLTIYAPAIVLTTVFGWPLNFTIISCGLLVIAYTVMGGCEAVTVTQKYQMGIIFAGMLTAACLLISKLPVDLGLAGAFAVAGGMHKLNAVNFSTSPSDRYTFWSGLLGGTFLMLSYFGTDQSQVQRYISGSSLRESRLGLLFNAVCKIPMQFCILMLGVLMFVFYQFNEAPIFFESSTLKYMNSHANDAQIGSLQTAYRQSRVELKTALAQWVAARKASNIDGEKDAFKLAQETQQKSDAIKAEAAKVIASKNSAAKANDADYVFITFILQQLPHGVIGLLIAAFFAAALSSKAAELNALGASTSIDIYKHFNPQENDATYIRVTRIFTALWGILAIIFALYANLVENLIQAVNILGSIFYGVMLGLFVVAFFFRRIGGTAIFWGALVAQIIVFILYFTLSISYLWYPLIGCAICVVLSWILQMAIGDKMDAERIVAE